jgi:hypothetical protein
LLQSFNCLIAAVVNLEDNGTMILVQQGPDYVFYDLNQVMVTTLTPPVSGNVMYVSNTLFDTDPSDIEYLVWTSSDTWIFKLDGTVLFHLAGSGPGSMTGGFHNYYDHAITNTENGAIMRLWVGGIDNWAFYQLPGCLYEPSCSPWSGTNLPAEPNKVTDLRAYPNPTASHVTIPYQLPAGVNQGELALYGMSGELLRTWQVGRAFSHFIADLSALPAGTYICRLTAAGQDLGSQTLILVK